jgi:hypothetical protein
MPRSLVPDSVQELSDAELIRKGQLAVQLASEEVVNREPNTEPDDGGDAKLVGENPWRSKIIIHNDSSNRLLIGWGTEEVKDNDFSFPIPADSTYHPGNATWWNTPKSALRYRFEGGAAGRLYVTDFRLSLSPDAKALLQYIRREL